MHQDVSPQDAERLQRAVLALALDRHPKRLHREEFKEELGDCIEVGEAIRFLVNVRLLRWEEEKLALTAAALAFDSLSL
jgi:hypothetical protein